MPAKYKRLACGFAFVARVKLETQLDSWLAVAQDHCLKRIVLPKLVQIPNYRPQQCVPILQLMLADPRPLQLAVPSPLQGLIKNCIQRIVMPLAFGFSPLIAFPCLVQMDSKRQMHALIPRLPALNDGHLVVPGTSLKRPEAGAVHPELEAGQDLAKAGVRCAGGEFAHSPRSSRSKLVVLLVGFAAAPAFS